MEQLPTYDQLLEDGRRYGELKRGREHILVALESRFGRDAVEEFALALDAIRDTDRLTWLLRLALRCPRLKQLRDCFPRT